jgi:hypothetical protein
MKCIGIDFHEDTSTCLEMRWTTKEICGKIITDGEYCFYDDEIKQCVIADLYTLKCKYPDDYSRMSKKACTAIRTPGEACIWEIVTSGVNKCRNL